MKLLFFTEVRLTQTPDKKFYSADQSFAFQMFRRYLKTFDRVLVVARSTTSGSNDAVSEQTRVDNSGVTVLPLPYYVGPYQYLTKKNKLLRSLRHYIDLHSDTAIICRVPGAIGTAAARYLFKKRRPYGVEGVGGDESERVRRRWRQAESFAATGWNDKASSNNAPVSSPAISRGILAWTNPFVSTAIAATPSKVPWIVPTPPKILVPPSTTAVIASNS